MEGKRQPAGGGRHLGFDPVRVSLGQLFLTSGWNQDVAVSLQDASLIWRRIGETHNGSVSLQVEITNQHVCTAETSSHPCLQISADHVRVQGH